MTDNPFTVIAKHLGCTPADVANMTWDQLAAARNQAQGKLDQATADLAWLDAANAVLTEPEDQ